MRNEMLPTLRKVYLNPYSALFPGQLTKKSVERGHIFNTHLKLIHKHFRIADSFDACVRDLIRKGYLVKIPSEKVAELYGKQIRVYEFGPACRVWLPLSDEREKERAM